MERTFRRPFSVNFFRNKRIQWKYSNKQANRNTGNIKLLANDTSNLVLKGQRNSQDGSEGHGDQWEWELMGTTVNGFGWLDSWRSGCWFYIAGWNAGPRGLREPSLTKGEKYALQLRAENICQFHDQGVKVGIGMPAMHTQNWSWTETLVLNRRETHTLTFKN